MDEDKLTINELKTLIKESGLSWGANYGYDPRTNKKK